MKLRMPKPPTGYTWELSPGIRNLAGESIKVSLVNQRGETVETSYAFDTDGPWPSAVSQAAHICRARHKRHAAFPSTATEFLKNVTITY